MLTLLVAIGVNGDGRICFDGDARDGKSVSRRPALSKCGAIVRLPIVEAKNAADKVNSLDSHRNSNVRPTLSLTSKLTCSTLDATITLLLVLEFSTTLAFLTSTR